jgi:hypothetical protein
LKDGKALRQYSNIPSLLSIDLHDNANTIFFDGIKLIAPRIVLDFPCLQENALDCGLRQLVLKAVKPPF